MASTSTIKTNCYNFLNSNLRNIIDNKCERTASTSSASASFDEFAEARGGRSNRASSLALPNNSLLELFDKEQSLLNPVNLKPTLTTSIKNTISNTVNSLSKLRRHSTSASMDQENDDHSRGDPMTPNGVFYTNREGDMPTGVLPLSNENLKLHQRMSGRGSRSIKSSVSSSGAGSNGGNAPPPPVPKRTFKGQFRSSSARGTPTVSQTRQKSYSVDQRDSRQAKNSPGMVNGGSTGKMAGKFSSLSSISGRDDDLEDGIMLSENENEDRLSIESSVFEDTPPYSAPLLSRQQMSSDYLLQSYGPASAFEENSSAILTKKMLSSSNRSSSDSNKSQMTIDTGYMSSTASTTSAITSNTESAAERPTGTAFRSRFSSEDTQSSLDSFMSSSELQQHQQRQSNIEYSSFGGPTSGGSGKFFPDHPSPSYLQTGGTSAHYLATGTNDVIEYLQKYSARNYPNSLRGSGAAAAPGSKSAPNNTGVRQLIRSQNHPQQQVHKSTANTDNNLFNGGRAKSTMSHHHHQQQTTVAVGSCAAVGGSSATNNSLTSSSSSRGAASSAAAPDEMALMDVSNSTSATNSTTSLSSATTTGGGQGSAAAAAMMLGLSGNHNNNNKQPSSLLKPTPPPSTSSASSSSLSSSSLGGPSVATAVTNTSTAQQQQPPHHQSRTPSVAVVGQKSSRSGGLPSITVPLRSHVSFDSAKLIQTGQILGAKITQHFISSAAKQTSELNKGTATSGQGGGTSESNNAAAAGGQPSTAAPPANPPRRGLNGILNKPPPLTQIHHSKMNQRQDSNISSDSFSITSSPGYNSKGMEAPLLQHSSKIHRSVGAMKHQDSSDSFGMTSRVGNASGGGGRKFNVRQDSTISSDSFSQTSSPGYNSKLMEAPLLAHAVKMHKIKQGFNERLPRSPLSTEHHPTSPIIKSASTPASLQTIVRFQSGSNMSLQHKIVNKRKNSNPYVTRGRLKFRLCQILINAVALLAIAGGLAAYFNAYPTVKYLNKTYILTPTMTPAPSPTVGSGILNPAPGVCLPIIVKFCQQQNVPYNFTVYPNYIGNFGQIEAQADLENYDALVDVRCYELVGLFLCSLFVPRCGLTGTSVPPCRSLCYETMRRCGFFFDVFNLELPDYLKCNLFSESSDPDECVGHYEVIEAKKREKNPTCSGFLCDQRRCIPNDWKCDGHVDCLDQTDEFQCDMCGNGTIYCGGTRCMSQRHVCDGVVDCPFGQDERNCIRLSERNGDTGKGILEVYKADIKQWTPACVNNWDGTTSPAAVCSMLGYSAVNGSWIKLPNPNFSNFTMVVPTKDTTSMWQMIQKRKANLMKEFISCPMNDYYPVAELACSNFECGKVRRRKLVARTRIVGGRESKPGDWPFIAAILGGPEEIFYCAGVLISDQWVLTASHCVGNTTHRNLNDWTIQLGITRRRSHTYYGQKVKVARVIPHPQYSSTTTHDNDIALFQLASRVAFHEHLLPVCLPPALKEIKPGTHCTVIGWGKREDKNVNPDAVNLSYEPAINEVSVPILHRDLCNEWLETLNVTEGMICAGYQEGGKDACQGDSGGPLLCRDPNDRDRWFVGGIVSWGVMCAHPKLPGVYANVPRYIPWIMQQIHKYSTPMNGL